MMGMGLSGVHHAPVFGRVIRKSLQNRRADADLVFLAANERMMGG